MHLSDPHFMLMLVTQHYCLWTSQSRAKPTWPPSMKFLPGIQETRWTLFQSCLPISTPILGWQIWKQQLNYFSFSLPFRTSSCLLPDSLNEKLQRFSLILFSICCLLGEARAQYFLRPVDCMAFSCFLLRTLDRQLLSESSTACAS